MPLYGPGQARRSVIDTVAYRAISQVATVLSYIVIVRGMTKEDFGVFNLLYAFIPAVSLIASLGLEQTLRRFQPEYLQAGNYPAAAWLVRFVASARFIAVVVLLAIVLLAWNVIAPIFKIAPYKHAFIIFCVLILLYFQARILQLALGSHMLHRFSVGAMATLAIAKLAAYSAFVWLDELTLEKAIISDIAAYAIACAALEIAYRRYCARGVSRNHRPDPPERKRLIRYAFFNNFNDAGVFLLDTKSDNFFIAAFIDPVSVGIYAFYGRLNEMVGNLLPVRFFDNVVQPLFFALPAAEANEKVPRYFSFLLNATLLLQWPVLAFAIVFHDEIVSVVFGGKFIEHSLLLPAIVAFATVNTIAVPATLVAQYHERAGIILASKIFAIYNVAALLALLPVMGLMGAVIASGSAQAFKNLYIWWNVRSKARWHNFRAVVLSSALIWGSVVAVCFAFDRWLPAHPIVHLAIGVAVCGLGLLAYLRSPAISASDRAILGSILRGKESRLLRAVGLLRG